MRILVVLVTVIAALIAPAAASAHGDEQHPLVIGHRGIGGYLPEHTLPGYVLAIKSGADYIEPDLVSTKDGHLIARHEPDITNTTDVASHPEFADRKRTRMIDGARRHGLVRDATSRSPRSARCARSSRSPSARSSSTAATRSPPSRRSSRSPSAGRARPAAGSASTPRPSTRPTTASSACRSRASCSTTLDRYGWNKRSAPVFIQSFEQSNLIELNKRTKIRLVQLIDANDVNPDGSLDYTAPYDRPYDWTVSGDPKLLARTFGYLVTNKGLDEVAKYADGIGPWKPYIQPTAGGSGPLLAPTDLVQRAHKRGLLVHPYTFRNEQSRLAPDYMGNPINEYLRFYELGVDGVFSDFADTAFAARELFRLQHGEGDEE